MKYFSWGCSILLLCALGLVPANATIWSTNFSSLSVGTFIDGDNINSGTMPLIAKVTNTDEIIKVVNPSSKSISAISFTDYSTVSGASGGVYASFASYSTLMGTGNLSGSFTFVPLANSSGTRGQLVFAISSSTSIGSTVSAIQIAINSDYSFGYFNGTSFNTAKNGANTIYLSAATRYTLTWWENYSSSTQDTYGFSINDGTGTTIFTSSTLNTRAANITPAYMLLLGGTDTSSSSTDPFVEIESVSIANVIPEAHTNILFLLGIFGVFAVKSRLHIKFFQKISSKA